MLASSVSVKVNNLSNSPFTHRVNQAQLEGTAVVDVDGSYLYRKYRSLTEAGVQVSLPVCPSVPLTGWNPVNEETCQAIAPSIPRVTSGVTVINGLVLLLCRFGVYLLSGSCWAHWRPRSFQSFGSWFYSLVFR